MKNLFNQLITNELYHLESPWFMVLFPVILIITAAAYFKRNPTVIVSTIQSYAVSVTPRQKIFLPTKLPLILSSLGLVSLMIAMIRPQHGIEETIRRTEGIDIMLALDVSGSMAAFDVPKSVSNSRTVIKMLENGKLRPRIDVAKEEVKRFIQKRPNDRIGLIAFSANTYTVCPPTLDHAFLESHLARLEAGMLPDGTGIAAPIANSTTRLKESKAKRRVLVLFTDGENNVDAQVTPVQAAKISKMFDVIIHTVGIGSDRAYVIRPTFFGRQQLIEARGSFNKKLLTDISTETSGQYFAAEDAEGLREVMKKIDTLEKTSMEQPTYIDYKELYKNWLYGGLILILCGFLLENTLCLRVP